MDAPQAIAAQARAWCEAGIIDSAQADRIIAFERAAPSAGVEPQTSHAAHNTRDRMQALFGVFGALLIGLGVLLTTITNWDSIGDLTKLALLIATMLIAYGIALIADARQAPGWVSAVAYVVGMLIFAGGVFAIADMYNIQAHRPLGMLLVAIFGTGIALLAHRMSVGWIAAVGWLGWALHEVVDSMGSVDDEQMMVQLMGSIILGATGAVAAGWALAGIARRAGASGASGRSLLLQRAGTVAVPLRTLANAGLLLALLQSTFAWHMHDLLSDAVRRPEPWVILPISLVAIWLVYRFAPLQHRREFTAGLVVFDVVALAVASWPHDILVSVAASALIAFGGISLALLGFVESRSELFGWGVAWLVLLVVSRYLDFMFSADLGGPGFIGAGLLLLIVAVLIGRSRRLWHQREGLLQ